jgi:hypothetical protein
MIIAATRMHRSLVDFASGSSNMYGTLRLFSILPAQRGRCHFRGHENIQVSSLVFSKTKQADLASTTLHRVEIPMDPAFEQHQTAQIPNDHSSGISAGEQVS